MKALPSIILSSVLRGKWGNNRKSLNCALAAAWVYFCLLSICSSEGHKELYGEFWWPEGMLYKMWYRAEVIQACNLWLSGYLEHKTLGEKRGKGAQGHCLFHFCEVVGKNKFSTNSSYLQISVFTFSSSISCCMHVSLYYIYIHRERIINIGKILKCHHPVTTILLNHVTQCCDIYPFLWCIIFNVCIYVCVFVYTESCAIFFKVSGRTFVYQWVSDKNPLLTPCFFFSEKQSYLYPSLSQWVRCRHPWHAVLWMESLKTKKTWCFASWRLLWDEIRGFDTFLLYPRSDASTKTLCSISWLAQQVDHQEWSDALTLDEL